jgi:hypothetical protein
MHRKAAIRALRRPPVLRARRRGGRPRRYTTALTPWLVRVWEVSDRLCGKLLVAVLPLLLDALDRHHAWRLPSAHRAALLALSPATADRLLRPARQRRGRHPRRPPGGASALAARVPIRTWGEWTTAQPGELQADLVLHCGETTAGFFLCTLVVIDVATGWTELEPVWGLSYHRIRTAIARVHRRLPFPVRHWHTDNGREFLNAAVLDYCRSQGIPVSRGRPYRKNDQAWVEARNWLAVRRIIGRDRYATHAAYVVLTRLYGLLRRQLNYLRPTRKLVATRRVGARTHRTYDRPQTPAQRLRTTSAAFDRDRLDAELRLLNPLMLMARIQATLATLWTLAVLPQGRLHAAAEARLR